MERLFLTIPNASHEAAYTNLMDRWEKLESTISPSLLSRYSDKEKRTVPYATWLQWCEDDRATGSALATHVPCTLYFLMNGTNEILGSIVLNHAATHRGHLHAGIAPWHRAKGLGTAMLKLALEKCRQRNLLQVEIVPYKNNVGAIKTILNNGGKLVEEFYENGLWSQRYRIDL